MGTTTHIVLMLGDVIGESGLAALKERLPGLRKECDPDLVVANGEDSAGGFGISKESLEGLFGAGVDCVTSGNHVWEKKDHEILLETTRGLLRPANYPRGVPGRGVATFSSGGAEWAVVNLQGRKSMAPIDCPFEVGYAIAAEHREAGRIVVVDFHAESFEEKEALAFHLDGVASVVAGTHTHVQTADERILPKGSGYIGDLGMCGPEDSVIGVLPDICLRRSRTQMPLKMESATGPSRIWGALFHVDSLGRCERVRRITA